MVEPDPPMRPNHEPGGPAPDPSLRAICAAIEMLVLDVDGVMTDGTIIMDDRGVESKGFFVRDGSAIKAWRMAGKAVAILSGRSARVVEIRARELGIAIVAQGVEDKLAAFRAMVAGQGYSDAQACFIGDDLPDLPVVRAAGLGVAVADAVPELRAAARYVTTTPGGRGAVREVIELMLEAQGDRLEA